MAIADAKEKAQQLASQLGIRLGQLVSFYEDKGGQPMPYYSRELGMGGDMAVQESAAAPNVPMGENQFVSNVNLTYRIR